MASKTSARELMAAAGVPIVPGGTDPVTTVADALRIAGEIGYPVAIKAAAGGGGKGIRVVREADELEAAYASSRREGKTYFADDTVYLERYLDNPRHIEVQVLADTQGNVIHLGERDCSIQRRHQKIVEETPSPAVSAELRERIGAIAVDAARAAGYTGAGTVEGLLAGDGSWYFLEMNTRLQVEHTVTEMVTGLDLVREQIWIASGRPLGWTQDQVRLYGHSIQCRINAEDAAAGFVPTPGRVTTYREPAGPGVRVDSGVAGGHRGLGAVRPHVRQAGRVGRGSRAGPAADAARARGVRDRRHHNADPTARRDHAAPGVRRRGHAARLRRGRRLRS